MHKPQSFTQKYKGVTNVIFSQCHIMEAFDPSKGGDMPKSIEYKGIWDTGATGSVITAKVAKELGLVPTGFANVSHAGGKSDRVNTYLINIGLPNRILIVGIKATEAILPNDTELLIGMDVISMGDFSISNYKGNTCFTFRMPSMHELDFVQKEKGKSLPKWAQPKNKKGFRRGNKR